MKYDKLYDMLLARRETRTITTLTIVTIASSASLLLFILYLQPQDISVLKFRSLIPVFGILFPTIGLVYREITYKTIHRFDNEVLNTLIRIDTPIWKRKEIDENVIKYKKRRTEREFFLYLFLIFPTLGWTILIIASDPMTIESLVVGLFVDGLIIIAIIVYTLQSPIPETRIPKFLRDEYD